MLPSFAKRGRGRFKTFEKNIKYQCIAKRLKSPSIPLEVRGKLIKRKLK